MIIRDDKDLRMPNNARKVGQAIQEAGANVDRVGAMSEINVERLHGRGQ